MPYSRPTLQEIIDRIISDIKTRIERAQTFLRRSAFTILSAVVGGSIHLLYDFLEFIKDQLFVTTADAESLEKHGAEYGIFRRYGEKSSGSAEVLGIAGLVIDAGSEVQSSTGNKYTVLYEATLSVAGTATLYLKAQVAGADYNEAGGITLDFVSPIPGIDTFVTVSDDGLTGGVDPETTDEYRQRILTRKRQPPHGGIESDYVNWSFEYSESITRAWVIPEYQGIGTVGVAVVRDNESPIFPNESFRDSLRAWIVEHTDQITGQITGIPVTAEPGFFVIDLTPYTVNFTIQLYPNIGAVQDSVVEKLEELFLQKGAPGGTISISEMYEAITAAVGEERTRIAYPADDVAAPVNQLHILGTVTFQEYT